LVFILHNIYDARSHEHQIRGSSTDVSIFDLHGDYVISYSILLLWTQW
jgi:hypothetical protein